MRVLILSEYGEGLGLAKKIKDEGHSVNIFIKNRVGLSGEEIVNVVSSWRPSVTKADLIVLDGIGFLQYIDIFKCPVFSLTNGPHDHVLLFNGRDWVYPVTVCYNYERMLTGDLGPITCSMGSTLKAYPETPVPNAGGLRLESFKGSISGFDCNFMDLLIEGLREPIVDLLFETATGMKKEMNLTEDYIICVRVMSDIGHRLIEGLNEENLKHIHLYNVSKDLAGNYYSWGGTVLKVTARGRSIKEARRRVYRTLKNIDLDDIQYRTDIGEDLEY